jgi:PAS domain S-box-containing protein
MRYLNAQALRSRLAGTEALLAEQRHEAAAQAAARRAAEAKVQALETALKEARAVLGGAGRALEQVEARTAELAAANALLRAIADTVPHLVWSSRPGGDWRFANRRWTEHTGLSEEASAGLGWERAIHPEDRERVMQAWRDAVVSGELLVEHRLLGRDGTERWFVTHALPLRDFRWGGEDDTEHWFGTSTDIDDAWQAKLALSTSEARFRCFAEMTPDVVWMVDARTGDLEYISPAFEQLWGESREAVMADLGRWADMIHPDDRDRVLAALPGTALRGERGDIEYRILRAADGALRWVRDVGFPVRDPEGRIRWAAGLARDITARKEAEAAQALLLAELNHRVKNALAAAQSVASQTARTTTGSTDFLAAFQARLLALAQAHDLLTREAWRGASLGEVIRRTLAPHAGRDADPAVALQGPDVRLRPEAAIALHMALHELATNAAKHGALSAPGGRVDVTWRRVGGAQDGGIALELRWRESGGRAVEVPVRRGFGSRLLEQGLPRQIGGEATLSFAPGGVEYVLRAPLGASLAQSP